MLGVFDSGFGGLTVLKPIHERLPRLSTIYLGDNARAPYGVRSQEEIFHFTLQGVRFLFEAGCPLVILACNTASSQALRKIQQEILPREFPDRRVLGVIRPAAEYLAENSRRVGILATPATVSSQAYVHELQKLCPDMLVSQLACPGLTDLIESGRQDTPECKQLIARFAQELLAKDQMMEQVLLACTHYPLVWLPFRKAIPGVIDVLSQGDLVARSLKAYLLRHPEIDGQLEKKSQKTFFTTQDQYISKLASMFYGSTIEFQKA
ncbi:glutamate racemase [Candidatus Uhrbacteria bacterium]|nr:glutamate racemase [Candidatus Uhrbacteria bacterium]